MTSERKIAVVTDSASSIMPGSPEAIKYGVTVVPLEVQLWENGQYVPHSDDEVSSNDFYQRMRTAEKIPQTAGALPGRFKDAFSKLSHTAEAIVSVLVTSKHSGTYSSALLAKDIVQEENPNSGPIEILDSKLVSIASWFPTQTAAELAIKGATLKEIKEEVLETISKTQLFVTLQTFDNLRKGGRADEIFKAFIASMLTIYPVLGFADGKLKDFAKTRSVQKAREQMIEMVGDAGKLVRLAVIHTNALALAEKVKEALGKIYQGTIPVYEAGAALAVHAGEGAVGVAFQKA